MFRMLGRGLGCWSADPVRLFPFQPDVERIREGLYLLQAGGFVNAYLLEGPRGLTLVDTGHPRSGTAIVHELETAGFHLKDIEQIVITHYHNDHCGGAAAVLEKRRVKVLAHPRDIPQLKGAPVVGWTLARRVAEVANRLWFPYRPLETIVPLDPPHPLRPLPYWQVLHTPGHTAGSISLYQPSEQVLLCGDALTNRGGRLRLSNSLFNDDQGEAIRTVEKLAHLRCEVLCCGHGPVIRKGASLIMRQVAEALARD